MWQTNEIQGTQHRCHSVYLVLFGQGSAYTLSQGETLHQLQNVSPKILLRTVWLRFYS